MSDRSDLSNKTTEEIDLGQLFKLIGDVFNRFFSFIASIFKGIFKAVILFLLFLQKHILKFAIAGILGFAIGYYLEIKEGLLYESTMMVEPNFNSVQQLYNNIAFYDELARAEETTALALALNISSEDAALIKEVRVESFADENQKIKLFDKFIRELDTITIKTIDFESYLKNFNSLDARFHKIVMTTKRSDVASKTQKAIVNSIQSNSYFKLQKDVSDQNIAIQDSTYNKQLVEIDSLQNLYKKVMLAIAKNPSSGTNINLADKGKSINKELQLIKERQLIQEELVKLYEDKAAKATIINVISDFPDRGVEVHGFFTSKKFIVALAGIFLVLFLLALLELNKYLKNYKAKLS
ncbi:hypothetical protein [Ascidiimonas sp. W6]|uniref:hypothetical protein n=1 Tax=Ascidiimonas meishanensis TaxID=3128903 RepID=UPI0030ED6A5C